MNSANHPKRIAKILLVTFFVGYFGFLMIPKTHALSADYTIKLCEKNFIGTTYKPYLHKKCGLIWEHLTFQILNNQ